MPDRWNPGIVFAELTHVGMRRANNQDSLACLPASTAQRFIDRGHLFVVADGMGAHAAGELASRMATEQIAMQFFRSESETTSDALRQAVIDANDEIHQRGQNNPEFHNMGTTASSLVLSPAGATVAHVGDSRVYRLRGGMLEQLTFDHSLVWEMEATGQNGQGIPKNVITRSLGPNAHVDVDVEGPFPVQSGDSFLLCSDGLTGLVDDAEIGVLMDCLSESEAVRVLVDLANLRGGPDNTSVIIVSVTDSVDFGGSNGKTKRRPKKREGELSAALPATAIACFVASGLLALLTMWGPMVVAILLGLIAAVISVIQWVKVRADHTGGYPKSASKGPYRKYDATPTGTMYERLGKTVQELKDAASHNNWMMDWKKVDRFQAQGKAALKKKDVKGAIRFQAEAIIETMNQLREQNNRAANETAIDY